MQGKEKVTLRHETLEKDQKEKKKIMNCGTIKIFDGLYPLQLYPLRNDI